MELLEVELTLKYYLGYNHGPLVKRECAIVFFTYTELGYDTDHTLRPKYCDSLSRIRMLNKVFLYKHRDIFTSKIWEKP